MAAAEDEDIVPARMNKNVVSSFLENIMNRPKLVSECSEWRRLAKHAEHIRTQHLRDLLQEEERCDSMYATHDGIYLDYSRQQVTLETMKFLYELAEKQDLQGKIDAMVTGEKINFTEDRAVLHTTLRADRELEGTVMVDGMDVIKEVHEVLDQVKEFTEGVRSGRFRGYTGKRLRNIVSVGIGGSYLGPEFLHECLKTEPEGINAALGYSLRFLSNVDPVDVERTCADLDPEETLVVVVSKTFTTAETMLNARTMRQWLWDFMGNDKDVVRKHMVACASLSSVELVADFGIDTEQRFFRFWDFVGGRYSVCSAAGAVPISLLYGFDLFDKFLKGANSVDKHFMSAPFDRNIPVLMGLLGVWNMSFLKYQSRTTLPYAEALLKLPAHIQQLDMESNGKTMTKQGLEVDYPVGEIDFGEAGTNGQHSFYQLLHMGQVVPCDFIGFVQSQHDFCVEGESLSSHDELMANFFAQPDALAKGKTADEVRAEGVPEDLVGHKVFKGNRPSLSLLLPKLTAYACGQLLAIYEHRTAVQGFLWDINSFDQWGVELGKKLACEVKDCMLEGRRGDSDGPVDAGSPATTRLLNYYLENSHENHAVCQPSSQKPANGTTKVTRKTHREHHPPPLQHDLGGHHGKLS
jgi:glucose-6-phosphate isomerase